MQLNICALFHVDTLADVTTDEVNISRDTPIAVIAFPLEPLHS